MTPLLYIDPGTGSMLFSVVIGLITTLYFVAKTLWMKIRFFFSGKNSGSVRGNYNPYVIYCEGKQYWNVFSPVVEEFERRGIPVRYLTSSSDDPVLTAGYKFVSAEFIGTGNTAFARLNMLEADICLMTTPGLDVYQLKRSRGVKHYAHLLHSVDDVTGYRLFGIDYFDSILLSGEYQRAHIRLLEEKRHLPAKDLPVVGCTYLDVLNGKKALLEAQSERPFTVLVAPSWGKGAILSRFGKDLLDPLIATGYQIIVRPHPQSKTSEAEILDALQKRYQGKANVSWDFERENIGAFSRSDVMISDFSSVLFDYVFLFDRPILYASTNFDLRPYDAADIEERPWKFRVLEEIGTELRASSFTTIGDLLLDVAKNATLKKNRDVARLTAWQYPGQSGARVVDYLVQKREQLVVPKNGPAS